jgi:hypothetical protein
VGGESEHKRRAHVRKSEHKRRAHVRESEHNPFVKRSLLPPSLDLTLSLVFYDYDFAIAPKDCSPEKLMLVGSCMYEKVSFQFPPLLLHV